jgi:hypothetical protein
MAKHGTFEVGRIVIDGQRVILEAGVNLYVDGDPVPVGARLLQPSDPAIEAQVKAFIAASLPALSAFAGFPIVLPGAAVPAVPIVRPPVTE